LERYGKKEGRINIYFRKKEARKGDGSGNRGIGIDSGTVGGILGKGEKKVNTIQGGGQNILKSP